MAWRWTKKTRIFMYITVGAVAAALGGFITYYSLPLRAEPQALSAAKNMTTVRYTDASNAIVLAPIASFTKGIVLYPGDRIDPAAYAYKMSHVAQSGVAVVIVKTPLHMAALDLRSPSEFTALAPSAMEWYVAGHGAGGGKACQIARDGSQFKGLILLGVYCPGDISGTGMPVLDILGSQDTLAAGTAAQQKAHLPPTTKFETVEGLNHAAFGDYGQQAGDGNLTVTDADALKQITKLITAFVGTAKG
jgi:hypothetical protein